jgi:hypothetical protein
MFFIELCLAVVFCDCAVLCVQVAALQRAHPRQRSPSDCVKDQETDKAAKAEQRAVEPNCVWFEDFKL